MRISAAQRVQNENRIRAAMDRLLRGEIPPGGGCDIKPSLRRPASTAPPSTATAPTHTYALNSKTDSGNCSTPTKTPDPKTAQIERLKAEIDKLRSRMAHANSTIEELTDFRTQALARLAAQHEEIQRLRTAAAPNAHVTRLPPDPTEDHRPILTLSAEVRSVTGNRGLSRHRRRSASQTPHPEPPQLKRNTNPTAHGLCGHKA